MIKLDDTSIAREKIEYADLFADVFRQKDAGDRSNIMLSFSLQGGGF